MNSVHATAHIYDDKIIVAGNRNWLLFYSLSG